MRSHQKPLTAALALVAVTALASACAAPEAPKKERRGASTASLGKPKPTLTTAASKEATEKYGITEWKMFRGKKDLFMTGYDAKGKAVKGVSLGFEDAEEGAELVTHINDGSKTTLARNLSTEAAETDAVSGDSADFLATVSGDLGGITALLGGGAGGVSGLSESAATCSADLAAVCQLALKCCAGLYGGGGWGGDAEGGGIEACWAAAKAAVKSAPGCIAAGKEYVKGIDLSSYGLPSGGGGLDLGAILGGGGGHYSPGDLSNPFGASDDLTCDESGDVDFEAAEDE